jgi:hypothetical protein
MHGTRGADIAQGTLFSVVSLESRVPADRQRARRRRTLAGDKGYDTREFIAALRVRQGTPQVAQNLRRSGGPAIDAHRAI